jgi:starch phosphorylase
VHTASWVGDDMGELFDAQLGDAWRARAGDPQSWSALATTPAEALWSARTAQRARLLEYVAARGLPVDCLIVGFGRRFTTYKRPALLLEDLERLEQLLANSQRPILFVFAGKAHPQDHPSKMLLQRIVQATRDPRFAGRLVFIQDYDVEIARLMVQGCDVWLNTPRHPFEASGTSGMKATLNGALHVSELDGWWYEAYQPELGWALGLGLSDGLSEQARDAAEARELMDLLEGQVARLFFARNEDGLPLEWLSMVKRSVVTLAPLFSADRMVSEYVRRTYLPAALSHNGFF